MGECFSGAGKLLAQGINGAIGGRRKAVGRDGESKPDRSEESLTYESTITPKLRKLRKQRELAEEVSVDTSLDPVVNRSDVNPEDLTEYGQFLGCVAEEGYQGINSLSSCRESLSRPAPDVAAIKPALAETANFHVNGAIETLPAAFGLEGKEIRNWLLLHKPGQTAAADLKRFITTSLAEKGHGSAAANWLYEQILAAGSTCLANQALVAGDVERCKGYLERTIDEIGRLRLQCDSNASANELIAQWAANADRAFDNERVKALIKNVKGADFIQDGSIEELKFSKKTGVEIEGSLDSNYGSQNLNGLGKFKTLKKTSLSHSSEGPEVNSGDISHDDNDKSKKLNRSESGSGHSQEQEQSVQSKNVAVKLGKDMENATASAFQKLKAEIDNLPNNSISEEESS